MDFNSIAEAVRRWADSLANAPSPQPMPAARRFDGEYNTVLAAPDEERFQQWKLQNAPRDSGADYDLRGAFQAGARPDATSGHWVDTFKKPNHPTFSNESQYAPFGNPGSWDGETFIPSLRAVINGAMPTRGGARPPAPSSAGVRG